LRGTSELIERVKKRFSWTFPWYSCFGDTFYEDFAKSEGASFGLGVFIRNESAIYQTYFTTGRGVENPSNSFGLLDITAWGRQETWEDSPAGWPQGPAHAWIRLPTNTETSDTVWVQGAM